MNPNTLKKIQRLKNGESFVTSEPGNSMLPLYKSNEKHLVTPITWQECNIGDVVFCEVPVSLTKYTQWILTKDALLVITRGI